MDHSSCSYNRFIALLCHTLFQPRRRTKISRNIPLMYCIYKNTCGNRITVPQVPASIPAARRPGSMPLAYRHCLLSLNCIFVARGVYAVQRIALVYHMLFLLVKCNFYAENQLCSFDKSMVILAGISTKFSIDIFLTKWYDE